MPNHPVESVKRVPGEKIQGNHFFFNDSYHQQGTGIQPEPAYGNLLEGSGKSRTSRPWGERRCTRASEWGQVIEQPGLLSSPVFSVTDWTLVISHFCFMAGNIAANTSQILHLVLHLAAPTTRKGLIYMFLNPEI